MHIALLFHYSIVKFDLFLVVKNFGHCRWLYSYVIFDGKYSIRERLKNQAIKFYLVREYQ